jgi:hypothetical protein
MTAGTTPARIVTILPEGAAMPTTTCAHCDVTIIDDASMVTRGGKSFCCENCAATDQSQTLSQASAPALGTCAHCHVPIVDPSTRAERDGQMFCCNNCAEAMTAGAGHAAH